MSNDNSIPTNTEAYYETVASQEDIYLEETEEELRAILTSDDPSSSRSNSLSIDRESLDVKISVTDAKNPSCTSCPSGSRGRRRTTGPCRRRTYHRRF